MRKMIAALAAVLVIGVGLAACSTGPSASGAAPGFSPMATPTGPSSLRADPESSAITSTEPCRSVKMKLASVTKQPDGATVYHFTGGGTWSNETVPAAHFDPLTATNAQLIENGYPPRPPGDNAGAIAVWKTAVEAAKTWDISAPVLGCTRH